MNRLRFVEMSRRCGVKVRNAEAADKAIIISTHILEEVEAVCSRTIIIARGKVLVDSTPDKLKEEYNMSLDEVFRKVTTTKVA